MAPDRRKSWLRRREAIALFGLLAGIASGALLTQYAGPPAGTVRVAT